ncbi:hypothetical protein VTN00DRAFT_3367 [Thermoascus crustaceus]|uniref:uncharacterized protein n=1 Tax=Thermoascus crustaceus TaxID=5088 RepID=UPI00374481C4
MPQLNSLWVEAGFKSSFAGRIIHSKLEELQMELSPPLVHRGKLQSESQWDLWHYVAFSSEWRSLHTMKPHTLLFSAPIRLRSRMMNNLSLIWIGFHVCKLPLLVPFRLGLRRIYYLETNGVARIPKKSPISALIHGFQPQLRIIFLPLDLPEFSENLRPLFDHYAIPPFFITERLHHVAQGSGSHISQEGYYSSWFHVLCKHILIEQVTNDNNNSDLDHSSTAYRIIDRHPENETPQSQSNFSWLRSAFYMRWGPMSTKRPPPTDGRTATSHPNSVTLICFGAPHTLVERFQREAHHDTWKQVVDNPFQLWVVVLNELFKQMDAQVWNLADAFRGVEKDILNSATDTASNTRRSEEDRAFDFTGLHNLAKHCVYLKEGFDAIDLTHADLALQHEQYFSPAPASSPAPGEQRHQLFQPYWMTKNMLKHNRGLFQSTNLRIASLDKRISHVINLAFNLVVQRDSKLMLQDSLRMETVSTVTLLFLPIATVATMFGSQFFGLDTNSSPPELRMATDFWIFWGPARVDMGLSTKRKVSDEGCVRDDEDDMKANHRSSSQNPYNHS